MTKVCTKCKIEKELIEFYREKAHKDGRTERCSICIKAKRLEYKLANPEKVKEAMRVSHKKYYHKYQQKRYAWRKENREKVYFYGIKCTYGIEHHEFETMLKNQGSVCAGCKTEFGTENQKKRCLDHCHKTGKVRGILCKRCNSILGMGEDNPIIFKNLINYLGAI